MSNETGKSSKWMVIIVVALCASYGVKIVKHVFYPTVTFHQILVSTTNEINKKLPMMIDEETQMVKTSVTSKDELVYSYKLVNVQPGEMTEKQLVTLLEEGIKENYKTNPEMSELRSKKVTLIYQYADRKGGKIGQIVVKP